MKRIISIVAFTVLFSCSSYKKVDHNGNKKQTQLVNYAIVIMKQDGMILFRDVTGWHEQTFHKPTVKKYNIGDTLKL